MARGPAANHSDKRAALRKGAAHVFASQGFAQARMADVARAAGVSKGTLYHYHASKQDLLFDVLQSHLGAVLQSVEAVQAKGEPGFRATVSAILLAYEGADDAHRLQLNAFEALEPGQKDDLRKVQAALVSAMSDRLSEVAPGLARNPQALREVTMSVFGMLNWHFLWARAPDQNARKRYAQRICDLTLDGVRASTQTAPPASSWE